MSSSAIQPKGLLRIPAFLKQFISVIREQQNGNTDSFTSLINPQVQISDIYIALAIAILLYTIRFIFEKFVFPQLFSNYSKKIQKKLSENIVYAVYYILAFTYFFFAVYRNADWRVDLLSNKSIVIRALLEPFPPPMNTHEHFYYSQAGGFYLAAIAWIFTDTKRSDFQELALHHFVTIGLISMSYAYGYVRTGMLILGLHDIGDVFLYSAKFLHYLGLKGLDTAVFSIFAVTFYVTRLLMFSRIVRMIYIDCLTIVVEQPTFNQWARHYHTYLRHYLFFTSFLGILLILHCFWFCLILKMIYREVFLGEKISDTGDVRSDNGDEDDEDMTSLHEEEDDDIIKVEKKKN